MKVLLVAVAIMFSLISGMIGMLYAFKRIYLDTSQ
jgi:hypothetical protein